jgi:hypothetical protein
MHPLSRKGMTWSWGFFVASVVSGLVARPPSTRAHPSSGSSRPTADSQGASCSGPGDLPVWRSCGVHATAHAPHGDHERERRLGARLLSGRRPFSP